MGLTRKQAFEVIEREREYQDRVWPRDGHPLVRQYDYAAPHLAMLEDYCDDARKLWRKSADETAALQAVGKMAAIAYRALTEIVVASEGGIEVKNTPLGVDGFINKARDRQDKEHPRTKDNAGQYKFVISHIYLLKQYLRRIGDRWYKGNQDKVIRSLAEVAAICVRAMEEVDGPDLLKVGLR